MTGERINIPDLPPTSADFDSYVADATVAKYDDRELEYRFRAQDGYARNYAGALVTRSFDGTIREAGYRDERIIERRSVTSEQQAVIRDVAKDALEIRQAEAELRDTGSYLADVLKSRYESRELEYRFRAQGGYARNYSGELVTKSYDGTIREASFRDDRIREDRSIRPEQQELVRDVFGKVELFRESATGLRDTGSYLADVLKSRYESRELEYRFRAQNGYARNYNGELVTKSYDGTIRTADFRDERILESRQVNGEQQEIIRYVAQSAQRREEKQRASGAASLADRAVRQKLPVSEVVEAARKQQFDERLTADLVSLANQCGYNGPDVDAVVSRLLKSGDEAEGLKLVAERRAEVADLSDMSDVMSDLTTVEAYVQTARRINLRAAFWKAVRTDDVSAARQQLESYAVVDDNDTALVRELRAEALALRRDKSIVDAFQTLGRTQPDFDAASKDLQRAAALSLTLEDEQGIKVAAYAAEAAYSAEVNVYFGKLTGKLTIDRTRIAEVVDELKTAPVRPAVAGVDYFEKFEAAKANFLSITSRLDGFAFEQETLTLRKRFKKEPDVQALIDAVIDLPPGTDEGDVLRQNLLDELALTIAARRGLEPARFAMLKTIQLEGIRTARRDESEALDLTARNPESPKAVMAIVERFQNSLMPLFESLRGAEVGEKIMAEYVSGRSGRRDLYVQRIKTLEQQRELTEIERAYLESVELLTVFNPHIVALAREAPDLTSLYLERYFTSMDERVKASLQPDMYIPVVQIGLGPNGVAAAGELNRVNPEAAANTLYIDAAELPGGPFGIAKGLSWELNSANSLSDSTNNLPDLLPADRQGISVRSYGSPLVAYPGERREGSDVREASINVTVDYLPNPDNVSTRRYPTNVDEARILQLQSALLVDNAMFNTRVIGSEPVDDGLPGDVRLTLEYELPSGAVRTTTIRSERRNVAGGLGEPTYGFPIKGTRAEEILDSDNLGADDFPLLTNTISGFASLSDPEGRPTAPKGVVVIYGKGNSTDVLIEYLGRQFESGNPALNGITKVVVIADGELSQRPRYAQINDLKARNGQPNFLEVINSRVSDIALQSDGSLRVIDSNGRNVAAGFNGTRREVRADHVIAATGFRPDLDKVFKPLLAEGESIDRRRQLGRVVLPSNPGFTIANRLQNDTGTLIVGTGSEADFQNPNKLGQLPKTSREALLRNGAENAVAIGFRTPDTRAATRLAFTSYKPTGLSQLQAKAPVLIADVRDVAADEAVISVPRSRQVGTRRTVDADTVTLSALFAEALPKVVLARDGTVINPKDEQATAQHSMQVKYDAVYQQFLLVKMSSVLPRVVLEAAAKAVADPYFQAYALKALRGRRTNRGLEIALAFKRGRLQYRDPGDGQPYADTDLVKGRTYVEAL